MKLTKGKLSKLMNKKKQTMKKYKKGKRSHRGKTFRKRKHLNLMKKTLKKWVGGQEVENKVDENKNQEEKAGENEKYVEEEKPTIDPIGLFEKGKERMEDMNTEDINTEDMNIEEDNSLSDGDAQVPNGEARVPDGDALVPDGDAQVPNGEAQVPNGEIPIQESVIEEKENVSITINTTMDDLINSVAKKVVEFQKENSKINTENEDNKLINASVINAENATF